MSWDGPAWRRRERREAKRRFVRAGWGDKKGMFGKVVLASSAQHPARGQPEPGGNGSPLLVWCTDPTRSGLLQIMFGEHLGARPAAQPPPTAQTGCYLVADQAGQPAASYTYHT